MDALEREKSLSLLEVWCDTYNVRKFWTSLFRGSFKDLDISGTY